MKELTLKNPDLVSFITLVVITAAAIGYGLLTWKELPKQGSYPVAVGASFPYDLQHPDEIVTLPSKLIEISGLSYWGNNQLLTVQDEEGKVFIYDFTLKEVVEEFNFGKDRDYEGISHLDSTIYVLERDGDVHQFLYQRGTEKYKSIKIESEFEFDNDTEGICYDPFTKLMLIAPKAQQLGAAIAQPYLKGVYTLDISTAEVNMTPLVSINQFQLGEIIYGERKRYEVNPSGVAVQPQTGEIYILSSVGKLLVVMNRDNSIVQVERLNEKIFPQPEGITFNDEGDLFISSEARGRKPVIARFNRKP